MPSCWRSAFIGLVLALVLLGAGCSGDDYPRSLVRVVSLNQNAPFQSDVVKVDGSGSPFVTEDEIVVEIRNDPRNDVLLEDRSDVAFAHVTIDRYEIRFQSGEAIPPVTGSVGWMIPSRETLFGSIVLVPGGHKLVPPLVDLGRGGELTTTARITFFGHEADSEDPIKVEAVLQVNFANWQDD